MMPVKICGITQTEDARKAIDAGASAIGFIFHEASPRYIDPEKANHISDAVSDTVATVGVFVDEAAETVNRIAELVGLDFVQLHGDESPEYCAQMNRPVIKSFRIGESFDEKVLGGYNVYALLFDAYVKGAQGGTGKTFNWDIIKSLETETIIILAGGINSENIMMAYDSVRPDAFDVSSGVEESPGRKNREKMGKLFTIVETIEQYSKDAIFQVIPQEH
ncbi:MAG: N-(5'-phosphoribosyl)anthranilate isomerase [Candidatus Marinimicrobia bacterium]|nr:N-(5'-phosphoribosyl)anthranilate isomerase [Candidatus Neomarinimicrobiota bacterium]